MEARYGVREVDAGNGDILDLLDVLSKPIMLFRFNRANTVPGSLKRMKDAEHELRRILDEYALKRGAFLLEVERERDKHLDRIQEEEGVSYDC